MRNISPSQIRSIAANPQILAMRMSFMASIFLFAVILAMLGVLPFSWSTNFLQNQPFYSRWLLIGAELFVVVLSYRIYTRLLALKHLQRRRIMIALEKSYRVAIMDESASHTTFVPTSTIILRLKRSFVWFGTMITLGYIVVFTANLVLIPTTSISTFDVFPLVFAALFILMFEAGPCCIILFLLLKTSRTIQATDNALKAERGKVIHWKEAHLFICYTLPSLLPGQKTFYYELSSSTQVITWILVLSPRSPFAMWEPKLPDDEYYQQMQALCELVEERTELPLHDLSKH